ncbi:MAG: hypothetical protein IPK03_14675 [Bacteroidetes bacterium]|nr:hypothetical protein [Bacteroidota bacterium]
MESNIAYTFAQALTFSYSIQIFGEGVSVRVYSDSISLRLGQYEYIEKDLIVYDQFKNPITMSYFTSSNGSIGIQSAKPLNPSLSYTIDPWIGIPGTLTSTISVFGILNKSKGVAVDFDNIGNLYVYGGGGSAIIGIATPAHNTKIAKYNPNGILQWTFMGSVPSINWESSYAVGFLSNIYTFKESGKILVGQGYGKYNMVGDSSICIRLNTNGVYDNFKSKSNRSVSKILSFERNCKTKKITLFLEALTLLILNC